MTTASIIRDLASGNQTGCKSLIDVHTPFGTWAHQAPAVHRHHLEGQGPSPRKLGNALQLVAANNLSDVVSVATARTNLWT